MLRTFYSAEEAFAKVANSLLYNEQCGTTLIRLSEESARGLLDISYKEHIEAVSGNVDEEIEIFRTCTKYQTIVCFPPMGVLLNNRERSELFYAYMLLNLLQPNGRLILAVPGNFMTAPYASETRTFILNGYCINSVIELPNRTTNGLYVLDIANRCSDKLIDYYTNSAYQDFEKIIEAIRKKMPAFSVEKEMLKQRWDAQFHNPRYNDIRKKFLSKDTVRLESLAEVVPGTIIRPEERKERADYLILSPRLINEGTIEYNNETAFYAEARIDRRFEQAILREGDIIVCMTGKIRFIIYHETDTKVVAGQHFCIIRAKEERQRYLQLYFGTQLGEENFNLQAEMLSVGGSLSRLSTRDLASFVVPSESKLELAAKIQESTNLINKISVLFEAEGWDVIREYRPNTRDSYEFDIALRSGEKVVGIIEAKRNALPDDKAKKRIKEVADKALSIEGVEFFILFINDAMYRYKDNKFFRIPEIPTPSSYLQLDDFDELFVENPIDDDIKEVPQGAASISDRYVILSVLSKLEAKVDAVQRSVDRISEQIQELSNRISVYQDLVERQLEYARDDIEEQERILKVFVDTCVERVTEKIRAEYSEELYRDEQKKLIDSLGESAWNKLEPDTQNFLVSSKTMYQKLIGISEIVDYSGVCLLVTKALELELAKRFCQNYIEYYKSEYPGRDGRKKAPLPIINKYQKYIRQQDFSLGSFPYIVGSQFIDEIDDDAKENIKSKIVEYAKQSVLKTFSEDHNNLEILDLLSEYADEVERVRKDYRNPSAHTNALTKVSAKECFDLVLDVEKLLKRMLDSFDE